jgi:GT2 family glycosyltransferase
MAVNYLGLPLQRAAVLRSSVLVAQANGKELLAECLPSVVEAVLYEGGNHEIIVVDNGSTDGSVEFLQEHFPQIKIVTLEKNCYFTGGNNAGAQAAKNDILVFLNNDMYVEKDFLRPLLEGFFDESVFAVSAQIFFHDPNKRREETSATTYPLMGILRIVMSQPSGWGVALLPLTEENSWR